MIAAFLAGCTSEPLTVPTESGTVAPVDDTVPTVISSTPCASCGGDCLVEELAYEARYHTEEPVDYADRPPAGGPHNPCWTTFGVHAEPVPDDNWVHNLEHGAVVFLYQVSEATEVAALTDLAEEKATFVVVTPYTDMESRFAAVAWGFRMTAGCYEHDAWSAFYDAHVDHGPESISGDPGPSCQ